MSPLLRGGVDVSPISNIRKTFSYIGHVYLINGNDSFTHEYLLVVNCTGVVFLLRGVDRLEVLSHFLL
jgi:hypothetical protein